MLVLSYFVNVLRRVIHMCPLASAGVAVIAGHPANGLAQVRDDLDRFIFLLGAAMAHSFSAPNRGTRGPAGLPLVLQGLDVAGPRAAARCGSGDDVIARLLSTVGPVLQRLGAPGPRSLPSPVRGLIHPHLDAVGRQAERHLMMHVRQSGSGPLGGPSPLPSPIGGCHG
jgi:hypothetical protein